MTNAAELTKPQVAALTRASDKGQVSSREVHGNTATALCERGLIRLYDRFPSGTAIYRITLAGRVALRVASTR